MLLLANQLAIEPLLQFFNRFLFGVGAKNNQSNFERPDFLEFRVVEKVQRFDVKLTMKLIRGNHIDRPEIGCQRNIVLFRTEKLDL